jgi:hypothetical protein
MKRVFLGLVCAVGLTQLAQLEARAQIFPLRKPEPAAAPQIPWEDLNEKALAISKQLAEKPTVTARGPSETFACSPEQYQWLLDNPDRAVTAWRRLGAKCVSIQRRGQGKFGYVDELGSDVTWEAIHQAAGVRIWYAEGKVKASPVLPLVPVKALVVLRHADSKLGDGNVYVQHQTEILIHTDSKAAASVTKLMGQSAPKVAEQGLAQLQLFFSAMACYVDRHPDQIETLFRPENVQPPVVNPMKK